MCDNILYHIGMEALLSTLVFPVAPFLPLSKFSNASRRRSLPASFTMGPDFPSLGRKRRAQLEETLNTFMGLYDEYPDRPIDGRESIRRT